MSVNEKGEEDKDVRAKGEKERERGRREYKELMIDLRKKKVAKWRLSPNQQRLGEAGRGLCLHDFLKIKEVCQQRAVATLINLSHHHLHRA